MVMKLVIGAVAVVSAAAGVVSGTVGGVPVTSVKAAPSADCPLVEASARGASRTLASGGGLVAVAGGRLVSVSPARPARALVGTTQGVVRHVAARAGAGTAYVVDRRGDDELVVVSADGTRRFQESAEVTHPAWSPRGDLAWATGDALAVLGVGAGRIERLGSPIDGATMFSPVFLSAGRVAAVVSAPPTAPVHEGERLGNLWSVDLDDGRWRRETTFRASGDRWVTVRTPIRRGGSVTFIKVIGRASASGSPRFELWRLDDGGARRVARLPQERYLAGTRGARLLWNVPDPATGRLDVAIERAGGGLRTIGCGAVIVDPVDAVDPDRAARRGEHVPPRGTWPSLETRGHEGRAEEIAVIVGDFATADEASSVAEAMRAAYPASQVEVVDSTTSPFAIRPGVFGALLHLPGDADATAEIARFRDLLPQYAPNSWVVTP